jgi:creatinine amidohydrolase
MAEMTYVEVEQVAQAGAIALWAIGAIEEHGPHLPLATDVYIPSAQLRSVQQQLRERQIASVILPPYYWGVNHVTNGFAGSIEIRPEVMIELMIDVMRSLEKFGFSQVYLITGHYDAAHGKAIIEAVRRARSQTEMDAHFVVPRGLGERLGLREGEKGFALVDVLSGPAPLHPDLHAGDGETSMMLSIAPALVRKEIAQKLPATKLGADELAQWRKGAEHAKRITPQGYLGDPARAEEGRGAKRIAQDSAAFAAAIAARIDTSPSERPGSR